MSKSSLKDEISKISKHFHEQMKIFDEQITRVAKNFEEYNAEEKDEVNEFFGDINDWKMEQRETQALDEQNINEKPIELKGIKVSSNYEDLAEDIEKMWELVTKINDLKNVLLKENAC